MTIKKANKQNGKLRAVVVTTEHRGVFFGYTTDPDTADVMTLECARMAIYWSAETRGILGLAERGPQKGSRISAQAPSMTIRKITAVMPASDAAVAEWEKGIWS